MSPAEFGSLRGVTPCGQMGRPERWSWMQMSSHFRARFTRVNALVAAPLRTGTRGALRVGPGGLACAGQAAMSRFSLPLIQYRIDQVFVSAGVTRSVSRLDPSRCSLVSAVGLTEAQWWVSFARSWAFLSPFAEVAARSFRRRPRLKRIGKRSVLLDSGAGVLLSRLSQVRILQGSPFTFQVI